MKSRTFKHHVTGRTIVRELNIPGHQIPEYHLPPSKEDDLMLSAIIWSMLLQPRGNYEEQ